jgi:hypothetical protein
MPAGCQGRNIAHDFVKRPQLMCSVTVVEWLWLPLLPVMVNVAFVPEIALDLTLMVSLELPGLVAGLGLKLALV